MACGGQPGGKNVVTPKRAPGLGADGTRWSFTLLLTFLGMGTAMGYFTMSKIGTRNIASEAEQCRRKTSATSMKIYDSSQVNFELPPTLKVEHTICLFSLSPLKLGLGHIVRLCQSIPPFLWVLEYH